MNAFTTRCGRSSLLSWSAAALLALLCAQSIQAQLVLKFGDPTTLTPISSFEFQPDEVQTIGILVNNLNGTERLSGYTMELRIADGGPPFGGVAGPVFTGADLKTGTPFQTDGTPVVRGGPNPVLGLGSVPQFLGLTLTTTSEAVPPEALGAISLASGYSLLATLTVSAAGFTTPQTWSLEFRGAGSSTFFDDAYADPDSVVHTPTLVNSTISIVPEPQAYALAAGLVSLGFAFWRRFRRFATAK
ncbi:MAG: hypothetical protein AB9869_13840 [Verrucomicrobiia bacterium]